MKRCASLHDIARKACVSHTTVSNVLNRHGKEREVSLRRAERIRRIAADMGYVPNLLARSFRLGKTHAIVVATNFGLHHPHVHELIEELQAELSRHGYHLNLELLQRVHDVANVNQTFTSSRCDGVISLGVIPSMVDRLIGLHADGMPVVVIGTTEEQILDQVDYDRAEAARVGVEHLLENGHGRIAFVADATECRERRLRMQGYREALARVGIAFDDSLVLPWASDGDADELCGKLMSLEPRPTALFCYSNELSVHLLRALQAAGWRVPEQMAMVALGNTRLNTIGAVPLTAVDTKNREIAVAAVRCLLEQIQNRAAAPREIWVKPTLMPRASSAVATRPSA